MRELLFIMVCVFLSHQGSSQEMKPAYTGRVDYTMGNFGTYDYPEKGDSVLVFIKGDKLNFVVFSVTGRDPLIKSISKEFSGLPMEKKKEYESVESPTKSVKTGNYDMKFSGKGKVSGKACTMFLGHYSEGNIATLTLMTEYDGLRLYDLCIINLKRAN
jgi:hypothetical protein